MSTLNINDNNNNNYSSTPPQISNIKNLLSANKPLLETVDNQISNMDLSIKSKLSNNKNSDNKKTEIGKINDNLLNWKNQVKNMQKDLTDMLACQKRIENNLNKSFNK